MFVMFFFGDIAIGEPHREACSTSRLFFKRVKGTAAYGVNFSCKRHPRVMQFSNTTKQQQCLHAFAPRPVYGTETVYTASKPDRQNELTGCPW